MLHLSGIIPFCWQTSYHLFDIFRHYFFTVTCKANLVPRSWWIRRTENRRDQRTVEKFNPVRRRLILYKLLSFLFFDAFRLIEVSHSLILFFYLHCKFYLSFLLRVTRRLIYPVIFRYTYCFTRTRCETINRIVGKSRESARLRGTFHLYIFNIR